MKASNIFTDPEDLTCAYCGKNLLEQVSLSMVLFVEDKQERIIAVKPCCKKECDHRLREDYHGFDTDGWRELSDFLNPYTYLKHIMSVMNNIVEKELFLDENAFEDYKDLIAKCYPYVARDMTEAEKEDARLTEALPF